jgi:uncharacterized protein YbjT (DUF2867 family)
MARSGHIWLFAPGTQRINPIHGADLAAATADATEAGTDWLDVGGPETFTHRDLAQLAAKALGRPRRVTLLPDWLRKLVLAILPRLTPRRIHGPAEFFLTAMSMDMVGVPHGTRTLTDHFNQLAAQTAATFPSKADGDNT